METNYISSNTQFLHERMWSAASWWMRETDSIYFLNHFLFSLAAALWDKLRSPGQALLHPSCPIRVSGPRWSFEADVIAHDCFSYAISVEATLCWSPVWLRSPATSSCWIKSSVSTLAACQQRSARAACLWKHNSPPPSLSYSNKEEHCRERRLCLNQRVEFSEISISERGPAQFK